MGILEKLQKCKVFLIIALVILCIVFSFENNPSYSLENDAVKSYMQKSGGQNVSEFIPNEYKFLDCPCAIKILSSYDGIIEILERGKYDVYHAEPCIVGENQIYNLIPGRQYVYHIVKNGKLMSNGHFKTEGQIRMISIDGIYNVRDIGGWRTSQGEVKYGRIIRGSEMDGDHQIRITDKGVQQLLKLGVKYELDLRSDSEMKNATYPLMGIEYCRIPTDSYIKMINNKENNYKLFREIFDAVNNNEPIYLHCWGGCDRTGSVVALIMGLIGVSVEDIVKDYEISSFSIFGIREYGVGTEGKAFAEFIEYIDRLPASSFQQKCEFYFLDLGFEREEIEQFRMSMTE